MPEELILKWVSVDLAVTRTDEASLTEADADRVIDVVVEALEQAGYDVFGTVEVRTAEEKVILAQIQEIASRLLRRKGAR